VRIFGHPVHVMLLHFPVAFWPAHFVLHLLGGRLPPGAAGVVGFWLLAAGTSIGWLAALCGVSDLLALQRAGEERRVSRAINHGLTNGTVLLGFTGLLATEYPHYPGIAHGPLFLSVEVVLLLALGVGNFLGGMIVWSDHPKL
jgi:uncharacterized membrane protein